MPGFSVDVPHKHGKDGAREKLDIFLQKIEEKYKDQIGEMQGGWEGDILNYSFKTFGITIKGKMTVEEENVELDGDLPFSAMMFKGKISDSIKVALEKAIAA